MPRIAKDRGDRPDHAGGGEDANERGDDRRRPRKYGNSYGNNRNRNWNYGRNRYNSGGDRRNFKRARFDVGERLKEVDLGITEYVGNTEGFSGTIKERFTDFIVHEINLEGEIAKLTNLDIPPDPEENIDVEELRKKIPEDVWEQLQKIAEDNPDVEIDVTNMDKDQRKYIHQIVKKMTTVISETKDVGDKKFIVFSKEYTNKFGTRRDNRKDWSSRGGDFCYFILHKVNMDTMDALNQIAKVLRLKHSIFSYAGTKDRRARTSQWISVKKMNPKSIMYAARSVRGASVGNFKFEKEPLKLGKLYGNRFTIALRNVSAPDEFIEKAMISLRDKGFINYYGLQRFGTIAAIPTHEIGKALLKADWEEAVDLILKPREGEQDSNLAEAREIFKNTKDARLAYQKIGRNDKIEAKLLWGININGLKNLQGALDMVPRNTMLMYVHAYQSMVWNQIVSRRIKEFGLKPVVGDLVYENPDLKDDFEIHEDVSHETEEDGKCNDNEKDASEGHDKTDKPNNNNKQTTETNVEENKPVSEEKKENILKEDDKRSEKDENERKLPKVKILTEEDLPNYTIEDIVMPQPGWKVVYPPYAKSWFDEHLKQDGLTSDLRQKNKKYTLSGSYRKILQIPQNLSWKIIRYKNKTDDLILSDFDELRGIEPLKDDPEGKFKALIVQMSLRSSAYATMALREVLKCDTSSQTHAAQSAAFHEAHEKQEAEKEEETKKSSKADSEKRKEENGHSTADEAIEKKNNSSEHSSFLEDSIMEEEVKITLKTNEKINSSMLEESTGEEKTDVDNSNKSVSNELQKHETDVTNDSGIETGPVINA